MEAMDIILATSRDLTYVIGNHPTYSLLGSIIIFAFLMKFYVRLTLGICDCDQDMTGKTVLITGATEGIGKATALDLAKRNARVIIACRNLSKAEKVASDIKSATGNENILVKHLDLCSFRSIRKCAVDVMQTENYLHVLINNAGISNGRAENNKADLTEDGCEKIMQTNHLGHFLFTLLLLDLLQKSAPSRIINVSSLAYRFSNLDVEDLNSQKVVLSSSTVRYCNSKLANILFAKELASRLSKTGVTVNALHPGVVKTNMMKNGCLSWSLIFKLFIEWFCKTPEEGAQTTIYLAVHPDVEKISGKYFSDCKEQTLKGDAMDKVMAKRLFECSEKIVGIQFPKT